MTETQRTALIAGSILAVLAATGYYFFEPAVAPVDAPAAAVESSTPAASGETAAATEPQPDHYPVPVVAEDATPLPELAQSDAPFTAALAALLDADKIAATLVPEQRIRRFVATIDNLPRERLAINDRVFKRIPGEFAVKSRDGTYASSPSNEARYVPLVTLMRAVGAEAAAKLYLRFYPLFDKAYRELGTPDRHFNDRLVQVIDHLLATPEVQSPIELVQPKVFYQFADPALEARSTGQKMMIRMGSVNAAQTKAWLRVFRAQVTGAATPAG